MEKAVDKNGGENQKTHSIFSNFFLLGNCALGNVEK
jgi:hypothetical protein